MSFSQPSQVPVNRYGGGGGKCPPSLSAAAASTPLPFSPRAEFLAKVVFAQQREGVLQELEVVGVRDFGLVVPNLVSVFVGSHLKRLGGGRRRTAKMRTHNSCAGAVLLHPNATPATTRCGDWSSFLSVPACRRVSDSEETPAWVRSHHTLMGGVPDGDYTTGRARARRRLSVAAEPDEGGGAQGGGQREFTVRAETLARWHGPSVRRAPHRRSEPLDGRRRRPRARPDASPPHPPPRAPRLGAPARASARACRRVGVCRVGVGLAVLGILPGVLLLICRYPTFR